MKGMKLEKYEKILFFVLLLGAAILLYFGWRLFWFLTDDAYISFRYVSNSISGYGYVWNPSPFHPVEGYTSFLWIVLLEIVWRIFNILPPESSNYLSLIFSYLTLVLGSVMVLRINWNKKLRRYRMLFFALLLLGVTTNRTFLTWSSSGLETAMFNFFLTLWVYSSIFLVNTSKWWIFTLTLSSTCLYLTRPDGLVFAAITVLLLCLTFLNKKRVFSIKHLVSASPLILILVHFGWRRITYGEWLPNTYYAKVTGAWPESGVKYLLSFILEYALWIWLVLLFFVSIVKFVSNKKTFSEIHGIGKRIKALFGFEAGGKMNLPFIILPCTALVIHISYYTFIVGGDHFEYRVYSHLILFIFISFIWLLNIINLNKISSIALLVTFILLSYPIPWSHWSLTKDYNTREETFRMYVPISGHWPKYFRWYTKSFDKLQFWLRGHSVCVRHQEHKIFHQHLISILPSRDIGTSMRDENFPVLAAKSVGVIAWVLPKINVIDTKGLNDYVIARNKSDRNQTRLIAHERKPPEGYVECFSPNVQLFSKKEIKILGRERELTAEDIIRCEREWFKKVGKSIDP